MAINALPEGYLLNDEYKIVSTLGQGGFGITYLAEDTSLGHLVAIKEFLPHSLASRDQSKHTVSPHTAGDLLYERLRKRFVEEAQLLASIRHPNIVKVIRLLDSNHTAYFVMEYEEGETLKSYLEEHATLSQEEILSIMMPIMEGTKYIHERDLLHRDIAPDNIYLKTNGMPILIDFGAARSASGEDPKTAMTKDGYSPPEQHTSNTQQNAATDVYALGAVMYRMVTGEKPLNATSRQMEIITEKKDSITSIVAKHQDTYSSSFLHAIVKAMDIQQEKRFQSVEAFQKVIHTVSPSPFSMKKWIGLGIAVLLAGGVAIMLSQSKPDSIPSQPPYEEPKEPIQPKTQTHTQRNTTKNSANGMMEAIGGLSDD